ncbi:hypothetical protein [Hoyosella altamirensis]|uniref:Uncharacterized protein n=1 Tax=Hoyosella altamirensis TaxID=616997 RepID=A0A839RLD9_9ACTN|nr:hypothetical protein [Hoyosella altamirensis]MBB3036873.1 hypothetical protein [Hoyosella altamirensis]
MTLSVMVDLDSAVGPLVSVGLAPPRRRIPGEGPRALTFEVIDPMTFGQQNSR